MPRAKMPTTAAEVVAWVDKHGAADLQRILGCSRRQLDQVILRARRQVVEGRGYEALAGIPHGAATAASNQRAPVLGHAFTTAEVAALAERVDPAALRGLPPEERYRLQRERQDQDRRARNRANGILIDQGPVPHDFEPIDHRTLSRPPYLRRPST